MNSIYQYDDYKKYLVELFESKPDKGRGYRKKLAEIAQCQMGYVSHVLNGEYDFNLEHAEKIGRYLSLTDNEMNFFILLVEYKKAGSSALKDVFYRQILQRRKLVNDLKNRVKIKEKLSKESESIYYSSWIYAAIHMSLTIPFLRSPELISKYFGVTLKEVKDVLQFLEESQLIEMKNGAYVNKGVFFHLDKRSPQIISHHMHWRHRAIQNISKKDENSVHYSSVFTVSEKDYLKLKKMMGDFLESITKVIKPSPEEKCVAFALDYYDLKH